MKRTVIILFIMLAMVCVNADWISLQRDAKQGASPQLKVIAEDQNHIVIEMTLAGYYQDQADRNFVKIVVPQNAHTQELGKSSVPTIGGLLSVPNDVSKVVIADYQVLETRQFKNVKLYPFQTPTTDNDKPQEFIKDSKHYNSADLYPQNCLNINKVAIWRNRKVVPFQLAPMQVRPVDNCLLVHTKINFTLRYEKTRNNVTPVSSNVAFEKMCQKALINYKEKLVSRNKPLYLIIVDDNLKDAIAPFADWKRGQGFNVEVVKVSTAGTSNTKIKEYIGNQYARDLAYVLLVGDPDNVPFYKWDGQSPSDFWYACLQGDDLLPEIAVGRISAKTTAEVNTYVQKFQAYHNRDCKTKALLATHKQGAPGKYEGCVEEARKASYQYEIIFNTRHGSQSTSTNATVASDIEEGRAVVAYRGHGSTTSWSGWNGSSFTTSNMQSLNNADYPVFFSIACNNCEIDKTQLTFGESCLKNPNGGGCAFLGASRPSYTTPNHDFFKFLFDGAYNKAIATIGDLSNYANVELLKKYGATSYASKNVKMYLWLGDPSQELVIRAKK